MFESPLRVAAVQAAPVFLDREASIEKAVALIDEASAEGVHLIGFPEGFLPGHPGWVEFQPFDAHAQDLGRRLFLESVVPSQGHLAPLQEACRRGGITAVIGACERRPNTTGSLFNSQFHIGADGSITCHHQKLVPTIGERLVHTLGTTGIENSSTWAGGTLTSLICGENSHPLAQYGSARAYPTVHIASWPQHFSPELHMRDSIRLVSQGLAYSLKCFVVNAVTTISQEMVDAYGYDGGADFLLDPTTSGRASIISPGGAVLIEAEGDAEQLVILDIDPETVVIPKMFHDVAGHYDRPELYRELFEVT